MPTCRKCKSHFPNRTEIEGRLRNLCKRKYYLSCSPFDRHNTRRLEDEAKAKNYVICAYCSRKYIYDKSKGHSRSICNSCVVNRRRFEIKKKAVAYKGGSCQICGYDRCLSAMTFHHLDASTKEFTIGGSHSRSWELLRKELDKCELLCANCHAERHAGYTAID